MPDDYYGLLLLNAVIFSRRKGARSVVSRPKPLEVFRLGLLAARRPTGTMHVIKHTEKEGLPNGDSSFCRLNFFL